MTSKLPYKFLIAFSVVLVAASASAVPPKKIAPLKPNVILITVDTLRADHVSAYGAKQVQTPAMDSLAADGVLFEEAISQVPLTLASHASILTGTYPFHNGVQDFTGEPLAPSFQTVAQAFRRNGYATAAIVSSFVLERSWGLSRGFDFYNDAFAPETFVKKNIGLVDRRAGESVDQAIAWVSKRQRNKPFFLWLHLYDPHSPYDPPEPFRSKFKDDLYSGEIAYADSQLARLFANLRASGLYEKSAIVLLSDHGESLGEHGEKEHGFFVYQSTTHVPLLMKAPGDRRLATRRVPFAVEALSTAPTLLELAGIKDPIQKQFQAESLLEKIKKQDEQSTAYSETYYPFSSFGWSPLRSLTTNTYEFIDAPEAELYKLDSDPKLEHNEFSSQNAVASVLKQKLNALTEKYAPTTAHQSSSGLSPEAIEKLRSLGYVAYKSPASAEAIVKGLPDPKSKIWEFNSILTAGDAFQAGDFAAGAKLLEEVRAKDPEMYLVPFLLGEAALKQADWNTAISELERCLKLNPQFDQAMTGLARALAAMQRVGEARKWLREAIRINDSNFRAWYQLAHVEWQAHASDATVAFEKMVSIQPNFALGRRDYGMYLSQKQEFAHALQELQEAIRLGIREKTVFNAAGIAADQTGNLTQAARNFKAALELDPDYPEAHLNLALTYQKSRKPELATVEYKSACRLEPKFCQYTPAQP